MSETRRRGPAVKGEERPVLVHFLLSPASVEGLDDLAWSKRVNRSELLREAVRRLLAEERAP